MNEHLFKLKKDGKTVGYLKYDKYRPHYNNDLDVYGKFIDDDKWCEGVTPDFDEMLPFVTKDKNGKDVFAGDKTKVEGMGERFEGTGCAELVPKIIIPLSSHNEEYDPRCWDIVSIEDKNND